MNSKDLIRNLPTLKRAVEEHKTGTIHRILKGQIAQGKAAERKVKELGTLEQIIDRKLSPVADTIRAQREQLDDATGNAFRMAAEVAGKLKLTQQEQRVFDALVEACGNELAASQSLAARYPKGQGYSRSNIQRIRQRIEERMADLGYTHPRTYWSKSHPLAHTAPEKRTGKKTGTLPAP